MDFYNLEDDCCKKKKINKYEREIKYKSKLIKNSKLYHGVYYKETRYNKYGGNPIKIEKPHYKKIHKSKRAKFYKKFSNRKIRNYNKGISNGSAYKKIFDYWWVD